MFAWCWLGCHINSCKQSQLFNPLLRGLIVAAQFSQDVVSDSKQAGGCFLLWWNSLCWKWLKMFIWIFSRGKTKGSGAVGTLRPGVSVSNPFLVPPAVMCWHDGLFRVGKWKFLLFHHKALGICISPFLTPSLPPFRLYFKEKDLNTLFLLWFLVCETLKSMR